MPTEIIVSLIALLGVVLSIATSLIASKRITNAELQKLRTEIQQTYADKLLEKRLAVYPSLYVHLSGFVKVIYFGTITKAALDRLRTHVDEWDSMHSILFTARTGVIFHRFRMFLAELTQMPDEEIQKRFSSDEEKRTLRHRIGEAELALKNDLGIYVVEFSDPNKGFRSYQEAADIVQPQDEQ